MAPAKCTSAVVDLEKAHLQKWRRRAVEKEERRKEGESDVKSRELCGVRTVQSSIVVFDRG